MKTNSYTLIQNYKINWQNPYVDFIDHFKKVHSQSVHKTNQNWQIQLLTLQNLSNSWCSSNQTEQRLAQQLQILQKQLAAIDLHNIQEQIKDLEQQRENLLFFMQGSRTSCDQRQHYQAVLYKEVTPKLTHLKSVWETQNHLANDLYSKIVNLEKEQTLINNQLHKNKFQIQLTVNKLLSILTETLWKN
ncbi:hypothetical protein [Ureaplasma ceti]|uniref:Uncharacterized protein n=1 Tax=Ureaplasma ceti TaxID=3119530 RepID=A0ABP9U8X5_9BACT